MPHTQTHAYWYQPLYQVSIEQIDPAELEQQRTKILQRTSGTEIAHSGDPYGVIHELRFLYGRFLFLSDCRKSNQYTGFRGQSSVIQKLGCTSYFQQLRATGAQSQSSVIDVLATPTRLTLGEQAQVLEKQGLRIADELREARQIRIRDDKDLICHL